MYNRCRHQIIPGTVNCCLCYEHFCFSSVGSECDTHAQDLDFESDDYLKKVIITFSVDII